MSEKKAYYSATTPLTVEAFKNRSCVLSLFDPNFTHPTNEEVKALREILGWSQTRLGCFVGKAYNIKGCRAVSRWEASPDNKDRVPIDYCAWQLMLLAAEIIDIDQLIERSSNY